MARSAITSISGDRPLLVLLLAEPGVLKPMISLPIPVPFSLLREYAKLFPYYQLKAGGGRSCDLSTKELQIEYIADPDRFDTVKGLAVLDTDLLSIMLRARLQHIKK